jgi:hypothetical protein
MTKTRIQSLRMSGPISEVPSSARCWPFFVLVCHLLCLLWAALTHLAGFALEP